MLFFCLVELRGFEPPLTPPTLPVWCATSCAIAPPGVPTEVTPPVGALQKNRWSGQLASGLRPPQWPGGGVCSNGSLSRVSGASSHPTDAATRIRPLIANAHSNDRCWAISPTPPNEPAIERDPTSSGTSPPPSPPARLTDDVGHRGLLRRGEHPGGRPGR